MEHTRRLLLATDFSQASLNAAHTAANIGRDDAELHILTVEVVDSATPSVDQKRYDEDRQRLEDYKARLNQSATTAIGRDWAAAPVIVDYAQKYDIDLIAVGTHARQGFARFFLGSVAAEVVRTASMSVLVASPNHKATAANYDCIVVAIDFSDASLSALREAAAIADKHGARLVVLHTFDEALLPAYAQVEVIKGLETRALETLTEFIESADLPAAAEPSVVMGRAHDQIVAASQTHKADLIVMGASGRGAVVHLLLGSVTNRVLRTAPCPVLVHRDKKLIDIQ